MQFKLQESGCLYITCVPRWAESLRYADMSRACGVLVPDAAAGRSTVGAEIARATVDLLLTYLHGPAASASRADGKT